MLQAKNVFGIFTPFPTFHPLRWPLCASFQGPEITVKPPVKITRTLERTLKH